MDLPELFEKFSLATIENYVESSQEEHLLLDFKTISKPDLSNSDDKRNLAKALSGFANSSGGMIVWGVDARKSKPDGPDVAIGSKEIERLGLFLSRLNELSGAFVRPVVDGVRHRTIETAPDRGFAVTMIPESAASPHMALGGEGRYYKRSGASFYPMEHFDIADMFGRR
jgi:predicted HTH transcriptional regulator